jgi:hypothetical protein
MTLELMSEFFVGKTVRHFENTTHDTAPGNTNGILYKGKTKRKFEENIIIKFFGIKVPLKRQLIKIVQRCRKCE